MLLSDLAIVEKSLARLKKLSKTGNKEIMPELKVIEKIEQELNNGNFLQEIYNENKELLKQYNFLTAKPFFLILNVSDDEIEKINNFLRSQAEPDYIDEILNYADEKEISDNQNQGDKDELYQSALEIIRSEGKASTSFLQRKLQIGYNRAARIIDMMENDGVVSKANHVGKRDVL